MLLTQICKVHINRLLVCLCFILPVPGAYALVIMDSPVVTIAGIWPYPTGSNVKGDYVEVIFEGTGIRWNGVKWPNAGIAVVSIDGDSVDTVNQYSPQRDAPFRWEKKNLSYGLHTLRVTVLGQKSSQASDAFVNFNLGFESLGSSVKKAGSGWSAGTLNRSKMKGNYVEVDFEGEGIRWKGMKYTNAGKAQIYLDGVKLNQIDQYGKVNGEPFSWEKSGLSQGKHTLKIEVTGEKNSLSSDSWLNYSGFETTETSISVSGDCWETIESDIKRTNSIDAKIDIFFTGKGIRWIGARSDDAGIASISLDGEIIDELDLYGDGNNLMPFIWEKKGLSEGMHHLTISGTGRKHSSSMDYFINYIAFQYSTDNSTTSLQQHDLNKGVYAIERNIYLSEAYYNENPRIILYSFDGIKKLEEKIESTSYTIPKSFVPCIVKISNADNNAIFITKCF